MVRFRGKVEKGSSAVNSWAYVTVPADAAAELGGARRVRGTIEGIAFEGTLQARGEGIRAVVIRRAIRDALGLENGREIDIELLGDTTARGVEVPPELAAALEERPAAGRAFASLSPSHQREYAQWIAEAKRDTTRAARVERAMEMIAARLHVK